MQKISLTNGKGLYKTMAVEVWNKLNKNGQYNGYYPTGEIPQGVKSNTVSPTPTLKGKAAPAPASKPEFIPQEVINMKAVKDLRDQITEKDALIESLKAKNLLLTQKLSGADKQTDLNFAPVGDGLLPVPTDDRGGNIPEDEKKPGEWAQTSKGAEVVAAEQKEIKWSAPKEKKDSNQVKK